MWHISIKKVKKHSDRCDLVFPFNLWLLSYFFELIPATGSESWGHVILVILPSQTGNNSFTMCIFYHLIHSLCLLYQSVFLPRKNISCIPLSKLLPILYKICKGYFGKKNLRLQWNKCKLNMQMILFFFRIWNR